MELTEDFKSALNYADVSSEDILYGAPCDMDTGMKYADIFLCFSSKNLYVLTRPLPGIPLTFTGYREKKKVKTAWDIASGEPYTVKCYPFGILDDPRSTPLISGGEFSVNIDGVHTRLTLYTGRYSKQMRDFAQLLKKVMEGGQITDDDLKDDSKNRVCPKCGTPYPEEGRQICPECTDTRSIFIRMTGFFAPHKGRIILMFACIIIEALLLAAVPYLSGSLLYDRVLAKNPEVSGILGFAAGNFSVMLVLLTLCLLAVKLLGLLFGVIQGRIVAKIVPKVVGSVKSGVFAALSRLSIGFFISKQTGSLMTRVIDDANQVTDFFLNGLPYIFTNALTLIVSVVMMFAIDWRLAAVAILLIPLLFLTLYKMVPSWWRVFNRRHRTVSGLNAQINDNLTGARVVRAFGQEQSEIKRFYKYNSRVRDVEIELIRVDNNIYAVFVSIENILLLLLWLIGSFLIIKGFGLSFGALISFQGYILGLSGPLDFMSFVFRWGSYAMNSAQRIFEIIDTKPDITEPLNPVIPEKISGRVTLRSVTFGYEPNVDVLKGVSFDAEAGKMLGIVGKSGAGKSTLVNLISRLYDPNGGTIEIDGTDVRDLPFDILRESIAMVSQETYIFSGTVADNIGYARPNCSRESIVKAARAAAAHDFITKMPDGYDTLIGARGHELSGGERQRISIARAILADPKILILDEATASVDTETELSIQKSLEELIRGRTAISIAHRLSTLRNADKLIVLDGGKITEEGTHDELYKNKGVYHELMKMQNKALHAKGLFTDE